METREVMERLFEEISQLELPLISPKVYETIERKNKNYENKEDSNTWKKEKAKKSTCE